MTNEESETTEQKEIDLSGYPELILERDAGEFYVVKSATQNGSNINFHYDEEQSSLEEGLDIREVPTRNLSVLVECNEASAWLVDANQVLRDWAALAGFDYYSYHKVDGYIGRDIGTLGNTKCSKVIPRFFRNLVDD